MPRRNKLLSMMKQNQLLLSVQTALILLLVLLLIFYYPARDTTGDLQVDFSSEVGSISLAYGANEDDAWEVFADNEDLHDLHRDAGHQFIRVWVSSQSYRTSTIPLQDGSYDFTVLDTFVNAVLDSGAVPFMVFAHAPGIRGEGHGNPPPASDAAFLDYVDTVLSHYVDACEQHNLNHPCDVNDWYVEFWNEPFVNAWWADDPPRFIELFNTFNARVKKIASGAKVGGFSGDYVTPRSKGRAVTFLTQTSPDFISLHHYGNVGNEFISDAAKMKVIKSIHHDSLLALSERIQDLKPELDIEIIEGEYNSDFRGSVMERLDEPYTAAWYASSLIWQLRSQVVDMELFYSGTSGSDTSGFGLWSKEHGKVVLWPTYIMKEQFVRVNPPGATMFQAHSDLSSIDILASENKDGRFVTIVNKEGSAAQVQLVVRGMSLPGLGFVNAHVTTMVDVSLAPYEVLFLQVQ